MSVKKFPVISENGNAYEVEIFFGESISLMGLNVVISEQGRGLFGRQRMKIRRHFQDWKADEEDVIQEYSYVDIAKKYVRKYEEEIAEEIAFYQRVKTIEKEFEEWDGIIRAEGGEE